MLHIFGFQLVYYFWTRKLQISTYLRNTLSKNTICKYLPCTLMIFFFVKRKFKYSIDSWYILAIIQKNKMSEKKCKKSRKNWRSQISQPSNFNWKTLNPDNTYEWLVYPLIYSKKFLNSIITFNIYHHSISLNFLLISISLQSLF